MCPVHVQRDTGKGWTMEVLCCDLNCLGKTRKPAESARKRSDGDRGLEPAFGHRTAVVCEVTSLLWSQWRCAGVVLRVAGSLLPAWKSAECCIVFSFCVVPVIGSLAPKATDCHCWAATHPFTVDIEQPSGDSIFLILLCFGQPKSQLKGGLIWYHGDRRLFNSLSYSLSMI